jgi:hypothetical protein
VPQVVTGLHVIAKSVLVVMLGLVLVDPGWGNLEGKAPAARAVTYPLLSFAVPVAWWARGRRSAFPWTADLMVTLTCFTDILGNRLDLYDTIEWFDDWMHFMNTGLLSAAAVLLTVPRTTSVRAVVERGVAVGASVALAWELFEYISFVTTSPEAPTAYADTIWDLVLGWLGAFTASVIVHAVWRQRPVSRAALAPAPAPAPRR